MTPKVEVYLMSGLGSEVDRLAYRLGLSADQLAESAIAAYLPDSADREDQK
jgi:hypothetical protein